MVIGVPWLFWVTILLSFLDEMEGIVWILGDGAVPRRSPPHAPCNMGR